MNLGWQRNFRLSSYKMDQSRKLEFWKLKQNFKIILQYWTKTKVPKMNLEAVTREFRFGYYKV